MKRLNFVHVVGIAAALSVPAWVIAQTQNVPPSANEYTPGSVLTAAKLGGLNQAVLNQVLGQPNQSPTAVDASALNSSGVAIRTFTAASDGFLTVTPAGSGFQNTEVDVFVGNLRVARSLAGVSVTVAVPNKAVVSVQATGIAAGSNTNAALIFTSFGVGAGTSQFSPQ